MNRNHLAALLAGATLSFSLSAVPQPVSAAVCAMMPMMDGMMGGPMDMGMESKDMMVEPMMGDAMMSGMMMSAKDGQCLANQSASVQTLFMVAFGDRAGTRWVEEHEAELAKMRM